VRRREAAVAGIPLAALLATDSTPILALRPRCGPSPADCDENHERLRIGAPRLRFLDEEDLMYVAPDAVMPVASAIATLVGIVLMFWRRLVGAVRLIVQRAIER
jgi:preprotein translocase subunit Sec61beta